VVDYSAIEARVVAWLSGEEWVLDAFRRGRDIYVETAERMGGMSRRQGKIAVLALGYNGGVESLRAMGADEPEPQLQRIVDQFRNANPKTAGMWREMGEAFRSGGTVGEHLEVLTDGDTRAIQLPSGRALTYRRCKWTWEQNRFGNRSLQASFEDPTKIGLRVRSYGGRLTENSTQAIARDILADALVRLEACGYRPVGHVHDEILVEGQHPVETIIAIMTETPSWGEGLPLGGAGFTCSRYRKD